MMDIGCLVITTNRPDRLERTCRALDSIPDQFGQKVISIDLLPEVEKGCEQELIDLYGPKGWQIVTGACTGLRAMQNNMLRGLRKINTEYLFYCEDHIVIENIPMLEDLEKLFRNDCGWINFNTHIHEENLLDVPGFVEPPGRQIKLDWINNPRHWVPLSSGDFLYKGPSIYDEYLLNFPAAITKTTIFRELLKYGMGHYHDIGIEIGFTKAWKDAGFQESLGVCVLAQVGTKRILPFSSFQELHNRACMKFRNNDPTMLHNSIIAHQSMPKETGLRRSFF
jgi:hypothetical protein